MIDLSRNIVDICDATWKYIVEAYRLLQAIQESIELDKMINNMELPTDEEVAEIEAAIANMPPLAQEEIEAHAEFRKAFLEMIAEDKAERDRAKNEKNVI